MKHAGCESPVREPFRRGATESLLTAAIMAQSSATTPAEYIDELPDDRAKVMRKVRAAIRKALPKGFVETMTWGMPTYEVPLSRFPDTYNKKPLMYAAIAAQKNHFGIYLISPYQNPTVQARLEKGFKKAGMKLDMGKSCVRFKKLEDIPLDVIAEIISLLSVDDFIAQYETARATAKASPGKRGKC